MPTPIAKRIKTQLVQANVKLLLEALGYDLSNPDLKDTPKRVAKLLINECGPKDLKKLFRVFPSEYKSMITLLNHRTFTRCPHHLERVELIASVAYVPNNQLLGLSKLARIVDYFSQGLMLQEEIAEGVAEGLQGALSPKGVAVHILGRHMCMRARGVQSENSSVVTSRLTGIFLEDIKAREEFYHNISLGGKL